MEPSTPRSNRPRSPARGLAARVGLALAWLIAVAATVAPGAAAAATGRPNIEVIDGGWGGGEPAAIGEVIAAVIDEFPLPAGRGTTPSIRVRHRFGGPLITYDRDTDGWIVMYLSARDNRLYQYVYQFAHEYCHLLAHFDRKLQGGEIVRGHQWFEESLCETASLYALARLAARWCAAAPGSPFREAAPQLAQYLRQLLAEPHRALAAGNSVAEWYARNRGALQRDPYLRELNELAAAQMLPLFEKDPARWSALAYLHTPDSAPDSSFADTLEAWRAAAPPQTKSLVDEMRVLFGLQAASAASAPAAPGPVAAMPRGPGCER